MTLSMYAASAPLLARTLNNLAACLDKAQAHADAKGFDSANYLAQRLTPDMLPLSSQIRIAGDIARMTLARLAGTELPAWPEGEPVTLAALTARVRQAAAYVESFSEADLQGSDVREIQVPQRGRDPLVFNGVSFLQQWAIPNVFFHATTTYALLRQAGVNLGKADFLG